MRVTMRSIQRRDLPIPRLARRPHHGRGLSLVELMVGMAIGLLILVGGLALLTNFTSENRRLLLETRLVQDIRAASDVITRDLRRAGYWQGATAGVWRDGGPTVPPPNDYRSFFNSSCVTSPLGASAPFPAASASFVCYSISRDANNNDSAGEHFGFHLENGVIFAVVAGSAQQALTDPGSVTISDFVVTPSSQVIPMAGFCKLTCTTNCPRIIVREFEILIKGNIPGDATIQRSLRSNVRVRNDYYDGQCPTS